MGQRSVSKGMEAELAVDGWDRNADPGRPGTEEPGGVFRDQRMEGLGCEELGR